MRDSKSKEQDWRHFERTIEKQGFQFLAGVDEVGRGCLAGPVVAAAVILPPNFYLAGINDSKKLSETKRKELFRPILKNALAWGIGLIDSEEIDRINILRASLRAMKKAVEKLSRVPDYILIDGRDKIPEIQLPQKPIIGGDSLSISIAAASIIAKVTRDRMMCFYSIKYPGYFWKKNKGYGTREHRQALVHKGATPLHRKSFAGIN